MNQFKCHSLKGLYSEPFQLWLRGLPYGKYTIILLTVIFMVIWGMTVGGFIISNMGANPDAWDKLFAWIGFVVGANAQKSIFLDTLLNGWDILVEFYEQSPEQFLSPTFIFAVLSTLCSGLINGAMASMGAKFFFIAVLGIASGPPGWLLITFAVFFGLMNALLVFSGKLEDIKRNRAMGTVQSTAAQIISGLIALIGLIMTFYPGVFSLENLFTNGDEEKSSFSWELLLAIGILVGTFYIEACYAYKKITHMLTEPNLTDRSFWGYFNKICEVLNALTVFFIAFAGGKLFAAEIGIKEDSNGEEAVSYIGGILGATISYAYTVPSPPEHEEQKNNDEDATAKPLLTKFSSSIQDTITKKDPIYSACRFY